jgi:hypothetical protein
MDRQQPRQRALHRNDDIVLEAFMLKIEVESNGAGRHIRLIGRVRAENIEDLSSQIAMSDERTTLDLREVTIVDLAAVRFLLSCEKNGLELLNCSLYIREWMAREQSADGS